MPNIKSAKKRVLISKKRNAENVAKKSRVKNAIKKYNAAIEAGDIALAEQLLPETVSVIDRAASDGVYHANTAARNAARWTTSKSLSRRNLTMKNGTALSRAVFFVHIMLFGSGMPDRNNTKPALEQLFSALFRG